MKNKSNTVAAALALAVALICQPQTASAQSDAQSGSNEPYRSEFDLPVGKNYTGRSPYMGGRMVKSAVAPTTPKPDATPGPLAASRPAAKAAPSTAQTTPVKSPQATSATSVSRTVCSETTLGLIKMSEVMPADATLGQEFTAELRLSAAGCAANVMVLGAVPANATYVRSDPAAMVEGGNLLWRIGNLDAGEMRTIRITFKAENEGTAFSCATVSADPRVCASTFVGKPALSIEKSGPETAVIGSDVTYSIVVKNTGTSAARGVVVTDPVPTGMSHSSGKGELVFEVGDLAPGQSKPLAATFKANQRGKVCNTATASSSNTVKVSDDSCTVILVPGLKVEKSGTKEQILGRNADYDIVVSNTGDTTLSNVIVTDIAPAETSIVSAPGANLSGNKATWTISSLPSGGKQTYSLKLTSKSPGTRCNTVSASSGALNDSAKVCTLWKGIAAVLLEKSDDPDPIQVGESTTYTIKVTNQGFADIHNVKIVVNFGEQVMPVSAAKGSISGKTASFPVVAKIGSKQVLTYTIMVKGTSVGDSRNKITLTCDELKTPVEAGESTTVY